MRVRTSGGESRSGHVVTAAMEHYSETPARTLLRTNESRRGCNTLDISRHCTAAQSLSLPASPAGPPPLSRRATFAWRRFISSAGSSPNGSLFAGSGYVDHENARLHENRSRGGGPDTASRGSARDHRLLRPEVGGRRDHRRTLEAVEKDRGGEKTL